MSDCAQVRICIDTGFSHEPVAMLRWKHLGSWAAWHAESAARRGSAAATCAEEAAAEMVRRLMNAAEPDAMDRAAANRYSGAAPVLRVVFYRRGDMSLFIEREGPDGSLRHEHVHGDARLRPDGDAWDELIYGSENDQ